MKPSSVLTNLAPKMCPALDSKVMENTFWHSGFLKHQIKWKLIRSPNLDLLTHLLAHWLTDVCISCIWSLSPGSGLVIIQVLLFRYSDLNIFISPPILCRMFDVQMPMYFYSFWLYFIAKNLPSKFYLLGIHEHTENKCEVCVIKKKLFCNFIPFLPYLFFNIWEKQLSYL